MCPQLPCDPNLTPGPPPAPSTANITHLASAGGSAAGGAEADSGAVGAAPTPGPAATDGGGGSAAPLAVILGVLGLVLLLLSALVGYVVRAGRRRKVAGGPSPTPLPLPRTLNMKELRLNMHLASGPGYARSHGDVYGPLPPDEDKVGLCGTDPYRVVRLNPDYNTTGQRATRRDNRTPGQLENEPRLLSHHDREIRPPLRARFLSVYNPG